jgi:hypothetical protein
MDKNFIAKVALGGLCVVLTGLIVKTIVKGIDQNSSVSYRSNEDGYKYKYCFAKYKIFSKKSENFQKEKYYNDKVIVLNSFKEILNYVWKLMTEKVIDGSGTQANRILQNPDINDVTKINVKDCCVHIVCDPTAQDNMFKIQGDDNILPLIDHKVNKNCFYIDNDSFTLRPKCPLVLICTLKRIKKITLSGNSKLSSHSQFCNKDICGYCSGKLSADGQRLQTNDLTINLSGNACMSAGTGTGEPTIHRNIKANVSGNSSLVIGQCLEAKLVASNNAKCDFYFASSLDIKSYDEAELDVHGGCKLTGEMFGDSKLSTTRYKKDYKNIKIIFSNEKKQWIGKGCWE